MFDGSAEWVRPRLQRVLLTANPPKADVPPGSPRAAKGASSPLSKRASELVNESALPPR